jgi:hypothetical protein
VAEKIDEGLTSKIVLVIDLRHRIQGQVWPSIHDLPDTEGTARILPLESGDPVVEYKIEIQPPTPFLILLPDLS